MTSNCRCMPVFRQMPSAAPCKWLGPGPARPDPGPTLLARGQHGPGPGSTQADPAPEGQGQGHQKHPSPGPARTVDSLSTRRRKCGLPLASHRSQKTFLMKSFMIAAMSIHADDKPY
ncbi:hypothetical protein BDZ97DRAFT_1761535 [Flammula alnicola]|nr:hypothetical protein BDZ97DRAFT_1761535 [Flammula alnicola]